MSHITQTTLDRFSEIRFHHAGDINQFFELYTGLSFCAWFRKHLAEQGSWGAGTFYGKVRPPKTIPLSADPAFNEIWDEVITYLPGGREEGVNLLQFLALTSLMINETGGHFKPVAELGGLKYMFEGGSKTCYNTAQSNTDAYTLFNDPLFLTAHSGKLYHDYVSREGKSDKAWQGEHYPACMPDEPGDAGILAEADFYKFRGRGLVQNTFRSGYKALIEAVLHYEGNNDVIRQYADFWASHYNQDLEAIATASSNDDWDHLFLQTNLEFPCIAIKVCGMRRNNMLDIRMTSRSTINSEGKGSLFYVGKRTGGTNAYGNVVRDRISECCARLNKDYDKRMKLP